MDTRYISEQIRGIYRFHLIVDFIEHKTEGHLKA